jgi:SPP1 gp7 family putative phage head morphogenesis protein
MAALPWKRLIEEYERDLRALFRSFQILNREGLSDAETSRRFQLAAERIAGRMVTGLSKENYRNWREAAFKAGHGRKIFEALKGELSETHVRRTLERIARENAQLITSVPKDVARIITARSIQAQAEGKRPGEIENEIRQLAPRLAENKIRLIARTEIGKAESAITQTRSLEIGAEWYQWSSSEDRRVRKSHVNMDKVLVSWNDPPSPEALVGERNYGRYQAGGTFNCRCVSLPVISLAEISWPARVFSGGVITRMNRRDFGRLAGLPLAA